MTPERDPSSGVRIATVAAFAALALAALGLLLVQVSEPECRLAGAMSQGSLTEPGKTGGLVTSLLAPIVALAALVLLVRARRHGARPSSLAFAAAILGFPAALLSLLLYGLKAAFACGIGFI